MCGCVQAGARGQGSWVQRVGYLVHKVIGDEVWAWWAETYFEVNGMILVKASKIMGLGKSNEIGLAHVWEFGLKGLGIDGLGVGWVLD